MRRSAQEWGEYVSDQGLYGLRANNIQEGGNLDLRASIPAVEGLDEVMKEDERNFQAYIVDPLATNTYRVTTEEVEREEDQGFIDRALGKEPETVVEEKENREDVWVAPQERDFFNDYDLDGKDTVSFMHIPYTQGSADIRDRGGNDGQYERLDVILPGYSDTGKIARDLQEEFEEHGNLNRFAEGLAEQDGNMDIVYQVTENGGEFAPEGLVKVNNNPSNHPAQALSDEKYNQGFSEEYIEMRDGTYEDQDLEVPRAVERLEAMDSR